MRKTDDNAYLLHYFGGYRSKCARLERSAPEEGYSTPGGRYPITFYARTILSHSATTVRAGGGLVATLVRRPRLTHPVCRASTQLTRAEPPSHPLRSKTEVDAAVNGSIARTMKNKNVL